MSYNATKQQVTNRGVPPDSFLNQLVTWGNKAPDEIFAPNTASDIYSSVYNILGPWQGIPHRRAVMLEVMRVLAGFESSWNWNEGVDTSSTQQKNPQNSEAGAFQVSADSMHWGQELQDLVMERVGSLDGDAFQEHMKADHDLAMEYIARLLRRTTAANGPVSGHHIDPWLRRSAVAEFQAMLQPVAVAVAGAVPEPGAGDETTDKDHISELITLGTNVDTLGSVEEAAKVKLFNYDGEVYPHDGCAITLSTLLQRAGIDVPDIYQAITLGRELRVKRNWQVIKLGDQQAGDVGSTCGKEANHGFDHIYLVLKKLNDDEMLIADNQSTQPHFRWASGQGGKTPTKFFLRAT